MELLQCLLINVRLCMILAEELMYCSPEKKKTFFLDLIRSTYY